MVINFIIGVFIGGIITVIYIKWVNKWVIKQLKKQGYIKTVATQNYVSKRFCINYVVDGNLTTELQYYCYAINEDMARYDFWDTHEGFYYDIISINVC